MKWLAILLTIGLAYGQDLPAQVAGTPEVACPEEDETVTCFELAGTLPETETHIDANVNALGLKPAGWFDTMTELMDPWDVTGPEPEGYRYTAVATDDAWYLVVASLEHGVMIVDLTLSWGAQP